ncbi:MAG: hypothetical protein QOG82_1997 [Actinomycetota bacterium]|jgi:hypothetical protein|nr:hypothetical protein [Actinomycetota bacterium]
MSATYPCETCGSDSATSDYCDVCGAAMIDPAAAAAAAALAAADATPVPPSAGSAPSTGAPAAAPTDTCYFCGAPRAANDVFCEVCGLDFVSGQMPFKPDPTPVPPPPPPPPGGGSAPAPAPAPAGAPAAAGTTVMPVAPSGWTAVVGADRAFFDGNVTAGVVTFPDPLTPRDIPLAGDEVSVGRRSESKGYFPDIDLSSPVDDPAVSRRHAVLQRQADGSWAVIDLGSTNGTWLNAEDDPLAHGVVRALHDGDRILLGAFTCITIRHDAPPPAPAPTPTP